MSILVLTTSGTIGALPYADPSDAPEFSRFSSDRDFVCETLAASPLDAYAVRYIALEPRDSKFIDAGYLENLCSVIDNAGETEILVAHGTDALLSSAEYIYYWIQGHAAAKDKTIVLTGSMIPLANGPASDGFQNMAASLEWLYAISQFPPDRKRAYTGVHIILSDYENPDTQTGAWKPQRFAFVPDTYEKLYAADSRYNRIRRRSPVKM